MRTVLLTMMVCACGDKKPAPPPAPADAAKPPVDAAKPVDAPPPPPPVDAAAPIDAAPAGPSAKIDDQGNAELKVPRSYVPGEPLVGVKLKLPKGWDQHDKAKLDFFPPGVKYDRPFITVNVQIDNIDPSQVDDVITKDLAKMRTVVVGGGHVSKILGSSAKDGHYMLALQIDAQKERSIKYVETTCYVATADQPFVIKVYGFAEDKDIALVKDFEAICPTVVVTP